MSKSEKKEGNKKVNKDEGKVLVEIKPHLKVLVSPDKLTPEYIDKLKKKYEGCTGKAFPDY